MRVLGVDPGTFRMGVGILEAEADRFKAVAFESLLISKDQPLAEKLKEIRSHILRYIENYLPDIMALENVFFGENVSTLVKIGEARASAMLAAADKGIPVREYPPASVKKAISGNGRASKIQVQQMVKNLLGLKSPPPVDAADALAVAICHLQSQRSRHFQNRLASEKPHVRIPVG